MDSKLWISTIGQPDDKIKLAFPGEGIRIEFPVPADNVEIMVNNYHGPTLDFYVYTGSTLVSQFSESVENTVKTVSIADSNVTAVEIKGGDNEASVVSVCYIPKAPSTGTLTRMTTGPG